MKRVVFYLAALLIVYGCGPSGPRGPGQAAPPADSSDATNDFYDNGPTHPVPPAALTVDGEVADAGPVDLTVLPRRSVIVKEVLLDGDGAPSFVGAYRYDGYSLFDILNHVKVRKRNESEFAPVVDLYVEAENAEGAKAVFSWGEIFYPNELHRILIADAVTPIVPTKTGDLWPLPATSKVVAAGDLLTERNIANPSRLTVRSLDASFSAASLGAPAGEGNVKIVDLSGAAAALTIPQGARFLTYETVFYGRGRGIHSTTPFSGRLLKDVLQPRYPMTRDVLQRAVLAIAARDGYRVAATYAEIFNRNDQQEFLLVEDPARADGWRFRIFPAGDFFSDRSIKDISEIRIELR